MKNKKLTKTELKKFFPKDLFITYSDVCKNKLEDIKEMDPKGCGCFIVYIENKDCPDQLYPQMIGEMEAICNAVNFKLNKIGYNCSTFGYERDRTKLRVLPLRK